ncbi:MAG: flagellar biosynthetic protein FliR, partial [Planctomycetota bacterium]
MIEKLLAFGLVLTRVSAFLLILPIFGWKSIPVRIKVAITF